jgi:hypothetical protein
MDYAIWLGSVPGVVVAALTTYLSQRRLQRTERVGSNRAQVYMELVDLLGQHNRQMWDRMYKRTPPDVPYPAVLEDESEVVRRAMIIASEPVAITLSHLLAEVIVWREKDEHRLDSEPRRYLGHLKLFGDQWHTPETDFELAGEHVDYLLADLCATLRRELSPEGAPGLLRLVRR